MKSAVSLREVFQDDSCIVGFNQNYRYSNPGRFVSNT
jgi:hypothetical protein